MVTAFAGFPGHQSPVRPDRLVRSLFSDDIYILRRVNPVTIMRELFAVAIGMQNIETDVTFFDLFEPEEMFDLWQIRNYKWYIEYASSSQNNGIMMGNPKPVLKNILETADRIMLNTNNHIKRGLLLAEWRLT